MLKQFGVLPGEARARHMKQREYLYCILQQWIDEEERLESLCPACRAQTMEKRCVCCGAPLQDAEGMENRSFDLQRYERMRKES